MNGFQIGSKRLKVQHKRVHQREDYMDDEEEGSEISQPEVNTNGNSMDHVLEQSVHNLHLDA